MSNYQRDEDGSYGPWWARGTKVKFLGKNGHDHEKAEALKTFEIGQVLTVSSSRTFGCHSDVCFEGYSGRWNTVMFESVVEGVYPYPGYYARK